MMRCSRMSVARPTASDRSNRTAVVPRRYDHSGPRARMFKMVRASTVPCRSSSRAGVEVRLEMPGHSRLCWECTAPLGRPVVPEV